MASTQYQYRPYKKHVTLCKDIKDLFPYQLTLPDCPPIETITGYGKHPSEQVFQRVKIPHKIKKLNFLPREDAIKIAESDTEISQFIAKMWFHFKFGDFQFINGEPMHISPTYWFFLNFWDVGGELPEFRYDTTHYCTDLWEFAWWDYMVVPNPFCYGMINGTKRRQGKSFKSLCKAYKIVISGRKRWGALQSKTDDDAKDCFKEKLVEPVLELPFFFKPFQANPTIPKNSYDFEPRASKGKQDSTTEIIDTDDYLFSTLKYYNSKEKACDGKKWYIHISDEDAKPDLCDVWIRHTTLKPTFRINEVVVGKEISTTTVEDMGPAAERWQYKWLMSDRDPNRPENDLTVNKNGETSSGLWQWFCPTRATMIHDKFGRAIVDKPTQAEMKWLKEVKNDPQWMLGGRERIAERIANTKNQRDRISEQRQYPEQVRDMFKPVSDFCFFDRPILEKRLEYFAFGYAKTDLVDKMAFINFNWKNNVFGSEVEFTHAESQDKAIFWLSYIPAQHLRNRHTIDPDTKKKRPGNWDRFSSGGDPFKFDTDQVQDKKRMSDAAMTVWAEFDPMVDKSNVPPEYWVTGDMCGEACFRDEMTIEEMNEQFLMASVFFGMKFFPEKNVGGVAEYFKLHHYEHYIEYDKKMVNTGGGLYLKDTNIAGSNTDAVAIQAMFKVVQKYVKERGARCKFYRTLRQLLTVTPDNMSQHDLFVSLAKCLRVVMDFNPIRAQEPEEQENIGDVIRALGGAGPQGRYIPNSNSGGTDNYGIR